jgi:hypothetical protein
MDGDNGIANNYQFHLRLKAVKNYCFYSYSNNPYQSAAFRADHRLLFVCGHGVEWD